MALVPISELKPGMRLSEDIRLKDGRLLLLAGFIIKEIYIESLEAFGVESVEIDDCTMDADNYTDPQKIYDDAYLSIKNIMDSVRAGYNIDVAAILNTVSGIVFNVINKDMVMVQISGMKDIDNYTYYHSLNVCIYSVITGKTLGMNADELTQLGVGALLHDIGKCKIPMEILMKPGKLTDEEFYVMKLHTYYGNEIILDTPGLDKRTATVALQHHEKWDGTGYPYKMQKDTIDIFARIVCVVDVYDAITSDRVYRKKCAPYEAFKFIRENSGKLFDPKVCDAFISSIKLYPENSLVVLSTGEIGRVISAGSNVSDKPEIYVFTRKFGPPVLNPYIINLEDNPSTEIVELYK